MLEGVDRLPGSPQIHRWADWAELLCLVSPSGELSAADLAEAARRRKDSREVEATDDAEDSDRTEDVTGHSEAEFDDALTGRAAEVFEYVRQRAQDYSEAYPFQLGDRGQLTLAKPSYSRSVYLFLLHCSSLRYIPSKAHQTKLASRFETFCLEALRRLMPLNAEVHMFGKNAELTTGRYAGRLSGKLQLLVDDLGEEARFDPDDFGPGDFGDNGLDLVAWVPMGDALHGRFVVFAQCACTPEWVAKQHSSGASAFNMVMSLIADPVNTCFIPYDFRRASGSWYKRPSIQKSVLVDRRRLLALSGVVREGVADEALASTWSTTLDFPALNEGRGQSLQDL